MQEPKDNSPLAPQVTLESARNQLAKRESLGQELVSGEIASESELLPPILAGHVTPALAERTRTFYLSVASMFDTWLERHVPIESVWRGQRPLPSGGIS